MYGAILGDMIGCPYEFDRGNKTKDFPLFSKRSCFTDDSVMTIAVADAFLDSQPNADSRFRIGFDIHSASLFLLDDFIISITISDCNRIH